MRRPACLLFAVSLVLTGCSSTQYKDASKDKGSREWGPREIKTTVGTMVTSLYTYLKDNNKEAYVKVERIRNKTSEHIDTQLLADELVSNLIKKRIRFIDDEHTKEDLEEMEKGMTGLIDPDSAIPVGNWKSPNYFLSGDIRENKRYVGKKELQYLVVTLKLIVVGERTKVWQDRQEFLKASRTKPISY
jgi:PBP1b-binding outer membrane lipoprotein LpoB